MWIKTIQLKNVKSFADSGDIQLSKAINIFIGPNGSGKSAILRGAYLLQGPAENPNYVVQFLNESSRVTASSLELRLVLSDPDRKQLRCLRPEFDIHAWQPEFLFVRNQNQTSLSMRKNNPPSEFSSVQPPICNQAEPHNFIYPYFSRRKPTRFEPAINLDNENIVEEVFTHLPAKIDRLSRPRHPGFKPFEENAANCLPFPISTATHASGKEVGLQLSDGNIISVEKMGEGTPSILALLSHLSVAKGKLFLIEELENDLHPRALKSLLTFIASSSHHNQFIISTHSNIVVSHLGAVPDTRVFSLQMQLDATTQIPTSECCIFRRSSDTYSDSYRTVIPIESGHLFRLISDRDSDFISDTFSASRNAVRYHRKGVRLAAERCPNWSELKRSGATQDKPPEVWLLRFEPIVTGIPMAREPLSMRQIKELLRLKHEHGLSVREIARSSGLPVSTVGDYLKRAQTAGLSWPLPEGLAEEQLIEKLLGKGAVQAETNPPAKALPDWKAIHQELRRKSVTLQLLWNEYHQTHPEGYAYSRFCELYREWEGTLDPVLRQVQVPGQKMFVDWAGQTVPIHNPTDGTVSQGHLFVAVLGASNKTFVEAFPNEQLPCWIAGHVHAYAFYGGVASITVPDNPKTAVVRACRYEPQLHRSYAEMAEHYGTVVLPARPRKPRDKAHVETGVQIAERHILAALRDQQFFSVGALNEAIAPLLAKLNAKPFQKLEGSRDSWFETEEKARLLPLPATPFQLAVWSQAKANIDYHVVVDNHFYSVPYQLVHQPLEVRMTDGTVELFHQGKRVAAHPRSHQVGRATTLEEHRPKSHQKHLQWTPSRLIDWAAKTGPHCAKVVEEILHRQPHPEMGYRSCLGIINLGKGAGLERLEAACKRALHFKVCSYRSVKSILQSRLENQPLEEQLPLPSPPHENLRGAPYYDQNSTASTAPNPTAS